MRNFFLLIFYSLLLGCISSGNDSVKSEEDNHDSKNYLDVYKMVEIWLESEKDYYNIPGFSVAVVNKDKIDWSKSIGENQNNEKISVRSLFSICSISKLFTSIGIMQLVNEKKINLDDPLKKHLPFFDLVQIYYGYKVRTTNFAYSISISNIRTHCCRIPYILGTNW